MWRACAVLDRGDRCPGTGRRSGDSVMQLAARNVDTCAPMLRCLMDSLGRSFLHFKAATTGHIARPDPPGWTKIQFERCGYFLTDGMRDRPLLRCIPSTIVTSAQDFRRRCTLSREGRRVASRQRKSRGSWSGDRVAWFLQQDGYGSEPVGRFKTAEYAFEAPLELARASNEWVLAEDTVPAFERLLALHDAQLATAPLHKVINAERRLRQFLAGTASSPVPEVNQAGIP
jgi:hypothetical protein